jgi:hypothetical protein
MNARAGTRTSKSSSFASGLALFAGVMMVVSGTFQFLEGVVAVADDDFYFRTENYTFAIDVTTWGWMHIIAGIVVALVGIGVIGGNLLARIMGILVVGFVMVGNFMFLPYYPLWSILLIAFNVAVVWGLATAPAKE